MRPTISGITPFFIVANVPATLSFYRDMLGFEVIYRGPAPEDEFFGIVRRDGAVMWFKALGCDRRRSRCPRGTGPELWPRTGALLGCLP